MPPAALPQQSFFDDLGTPLHAATFVVVDLETTGGSPEHCRITEFGAVKVRGGEVLGSFQSLVDPCQPVPVSISALTGITDAMVAGRPPLEAVLPTFLEFCRGAALVAHNARFDVAFLNAGLARLDYPRLANPVVCTAALARRLVREEVSNCKLATLATFFRCRTRPLHRALPDARATVEVFHGLLERAASFGVLTLDDLVAFSRVRNAPLFASRRPLADGLPHTAGVYAFASASGEVLYVGKASDLRTRVRAYFGSDDRRKVVDLLKETAEVRHWVCPTPLEAAVREVRLIHAHRPRFNRRSKTPERGVYLKLTAERFPRLSLVGQVRGDDVHLGPLPSRRAAQLSVDAIHDVVPLRRCTARIGSRTRFPACVLAEIGRCRSPCDGSVSPDTYRDDVAVVVAAITGDPTPLLAPLQARMRALARQGRFEEAAGARDRLRALVAALQRTRCLVATAAAGAVVAARPARTRGVAEVVAARAGRLLASRTCPWEALPATVAELWAAARQPPRDVPEGPVPLGDAAEVELVGRWLDSAVVQHCDGVLAAPVAGGRALAAFSERLGRASSGSGRPGDELADKRTRRAPAGDAAAPQRLQRSPAL